MVRFTLTLFAFSTSLFSVLGAVKGVPATVEERAAASEGHIFMAPKASVHVGNIGKDAGKAFSKDMFNKLKALCPDPPAGANGACRSDISTQIDKIWTVAGNSNMQGSLIFTFEDTNTYESVHARDKMLANGVVAFKEAALKNCKPVPYKFFENAAVGKCKAVDYRKRGPAMGGGGGGGSGRTGGSGSNISPGNQPTCNGKMTICNGPDTIHVVLAGENPGENAYVNELAFKMKFQVDVNKGPLAFLDWICKQVSSLVIGEAIKALPELGPAKNFIDDGISAMCGDK